MLTDVIRHYLTDDSIAHSALDGQPSTTHTQKISSVTPQNNEYDKISTYKLNTLDRFRLLAYLKTIGETDPSVIDEYLTECAANDAILHYALQLAEDTLRISHGDTRGFVRCASCRHLQGNQCALFAWRIVADNWRRCRDFGQ